MPGQPPTIRQLPEAVANQIAAGEVVERPAAVVKELCENALDAGASRIAVRIEDGGRRLVAVADDGHGMRRDDLALALARHATSKLSSSEDLFRIATLGFRGEALPSIAAVSEFSIASRPHDQEGGWRLAVASSRVLPAEPYAMACGTRLEVRNLFWNVPARLKFLKSEAAESGQVTDQLMRLALSHPRVAFRLDAGQAEDERTLIDLPAGQTLGDRVRALFGRALSERLIAVAAGSGVMQISGFIAHPQEARPTAKRQYLFLNGRFVRDRLLFAAVREGFKGFLEPRLHGTVFLHLDIDPAQVDVNVHPTKSEVRFRREGEVFALVSGALHSALDAGAGGFSLLAAGEVASAPGSRPGAGAASSAAPAIISRQLVRPGPGEPAALQERYLPRIPDPAPASTGAGSGAGAAPAAGSSAAGSSAKTSATAAGFAAASPPAAAGSAASAPADALDAAQRWRAGGWARMTAGISPGCGGCSSSTACSCSSRPTRASAWSTSMPCTRRRCSC